MTILKCLVVDDEAPAIRLLETYINKVSFLEIKASTTDPIEAIAIIEKECIDLVFLDIQMPNITGIQLSKIIKGKVAIIFTTAYPQFALESYELDAIDYLLKPFEFERFYQAVLKVKDSGDIKKPSSQETFIFIKTDGKNNFEKVNYKDIVYLNSVKNYVSVQLNNKQIITYSTLKYFEIELPKDQFIQIHKSYIVATGQINKTDSLNVYMSNGDALPIGDTYRKSFFKLINKLML